MNQKLISALLAGAMLTSCLPAVMAAEEPPAPVLNKTEHKQYISGFADGTFGPEQNITRAETAQLFYNLLTTLPQSSATGFGDVSTDAWYAKSVGALSSLGVLKGYEGNTFRPDSPITRAEFAAMVTRFAYDKADIDVANRIPDVPSDNWAYQAVNTTINRGWVQGYEDGSFRPSSNITRAEAVTIVNRMLERSADRLAIAMSTDTRVMPDMTDAHWAYYEFLEATTEHEHQIADGKETWTSHKAPTTALAAGWHNIGGELFHVNENSLFDYNTTIDGLDLDGNGRYAAGDAELDARLTEIAAQVVNDGMTQPQRLRAMYDYMKANYGYLPTGTIATGETGWEMDKAKEMLTRMKGNCYSWSAGFTYLARKVGYPANAIAGEGVSPKGSTSVHAWTEISIDGTLYTFDPQIESVYASLYGENYDLYMKPYGEAEWGYNKPESQPIETPTTGEIDPTLASILDQVYQGIEAPAVGRTQLTAENEAYYLGLDTIPFEVGVASEALINAVPHSIVLIKVPQGSNIEQIKTQIKDNVDNYKWVCVGVDKDDVLVENVGSYVLLVMDINSQAYMTNFKNAMAAMPNPA